MVRARAVVASALLFGTASTGAAPADLPTEYHVKAAYLYNFAKFVQWPGDSSGEEQVFIITILGRDPFGSALDDTLRGKSIDNKRIVLRRALRAEDVAPSQVIFISDSERDRLQPILQQLGTRAVLTVGEMSQFAERGGMIRFKMDQDRVHLEINLVAAERSRLRISSQLLKLAQIVDPSKGG